LFICAKHLFVAVKDWLIDGTLLDTLRLIFYPTLPSSDLLFRAKHLSSAAWSPPTRGARCRRRD
jgi:hypothetical protein